MTKPVEAHELSGLLDGELDPQRAAEVRRALESDPELKAEFARMAGLEQRWSAAASRAAFWPSVALPEATAHAHRWIHAWAAFLPFLLVARCLSKLTLAPGAQWTVQALALGGLVVLLFWLDAKWGGDAPSTQEPITQ